ncbi:MAG: DUF5722 domain-containing protein [Roseibacillus sp.]
MTAALFAVTPLKLTPTSLDKNRVTHSDQGVIGLTADGLASLTLVPSSPPSANETVLEAEVFSLGGCPKILAFSSPTTEPDEGLSLRPLFHAEAWTPYSTPLAGLPGDMEALEQLRLDFHLPPGASLQLRNLRLRPLKPDEFDQRFDGKVQKRQQAIATYLPAQFENTIENISVTPNEIEVTFRINKPTNQIHLAEVPIFRAMDDPTRFEFLIPVSPSSGQATTLTFPRHRDRLGQKYDRLTSRWQLVQVHGTKRTLLSHARYPDHIQSLNPHLPAVNPRHKKGLGGWSARRVPHGELEALDISAVTVNIVLQTLLSNSPKPNHEPFQWQGRTFYANQRALAGHDATMLAAAKNNALVSPVLLLGNPARSSDSAVQTMGHPDAHPEGIFSMPNMDSQKAVEMYGAALHLLASRYSRPDGKYGRIHHYIVHNEVDAGWTWTNCGEKPLAYYLDFYHRSCRLVDLIAREQNPNARTFISLTHHWAETVNKRFYPSRDIMEEFVRWTKAEGDFPWALAHHPYPQSLRHPRTWEDNQATMSFDSKKITPHNIEVLDAWMKRPDMRDRYGNTRPVHLSENGFNSPDYSPESLRDQAAGMAYAWKKIQGLETIEMWQYHNWIDNRHEGNLRIGLRKFPDDATDPLGKKPIWHLYQALGSSKEDAACAPYLPVIGIPDWSDALRSMN